MKRGPKTGTSGEKHQRGTYRPDRHAALTDQPPGNDQPPTPPDWLTARGLEVWGELVPHVVRSRMATDDDSTGLGNLANLIGALATAWQAGDVPPISALAEARRMAAAFGLAGVVSRRLPGAPGGAHGRR